MNEKIRHLLDQMSALEDDLRREVQEQEANALYQIKGKRIEFEAAVRQAHLPIAQRAQQRKNLIDAVPMGARGDGLAGRGDRRIFARLIYAPKLIATCAYSTWATARFGL